MKKLKAFLVVDNLNIHRSRVRYSLYVRHCDWPSIKKKCAITLLSPPSYCLVFTFVCMDGPCTVNPIPCLLVATSEFQVERRWEKVDGLELDLKAKKSWAIVFFFLSLWSQAICCWFWPQSTHTEWKRPLSCVHSIMMEKLAQAGEWVVHSTPIPLHYIYHHVQSCRLQCTLQLRGQIHSPPHFIFTPICTLVADGINNTTEQKGRQ